jgi:molecular chaperone DnaK (HSP70)
LDNIPPAKHHQPQIEVTFEYDLNSILNVSATEKSTGYSNKITVVNNTNKLSKAEIEQQIQEANKSREEEKKEKERVSFMNNLIRYVEDLHNKINDQTISLRIKTSDKEELEAKIKSTKEWIDDNSKASKHEIIEQRDTLERMALPILNKL